MKALKKTISFRILAILATVGVAWGITGNYQLGATIGVAQGAVNSVLYYTHEKAWELDDANLKQEMIKIKRKEDSKKIPREWKEHGVDL